MFRDAERCKIEFQKKLSPLVDECRPEPFGCNVCGAFFPSCYYSVDALEALNILSSSESFMHQGNEAFDRAVVGFGRLPKFLYVQVAILSSNKICNVQVDYLYAYLPSAASDSVRLKMNA